MKSIQNNKIRKATVVMQGGAVLGAHTAGVLTPIILDPTIQITDIFGTSAGAMNGMLVTQTINKFGYGPKGRKETILRLGEFWHDIKTPDLPFGVQDTIDIMASLHPLTKYYATNALNYHIQKYVINPRALQSGRLINLTVNAVNKETNQERLFKNEEITHEALQASAAIHPDFHSVTIDGKSYIDGAHFGGSNPPIEPLTSVFNRIDAIIFIMTNPPESPILCRKQSEITRDELYDTNDLILHQSYDHIAYLLDQREKGANIPPIHLIWPNVARPYTQAEKQDRRASFVNELFNNGIDLGHAFTQKNKITLTQKSSHSLKSLKEHALRRLAVA